MFKTILRVAENDIVAPLTRRVGTAVSAYLVGIGVAHDQATTISAGVVVAIGLAVDLALSRIDRVSR